MEYMTMVSNLLQDEFIDLLLQLPDEFFKFTEEQKKEAWKAIHHELVHGVKDTQKLASLIDPLEVSV